MEIGMLWMDASGLSLVEKIRTAAREYQKKYGQAPRVCGVHPGCSLETVDGILIVEERSIMENNFWLGMEA